MNFNYQKFVNEITGGHHWYSKWNQKFINDLSDIDWGYPTLSSDGSELEFYSWCREPGRKKHRHMRVVLPINDRPIRIEMDKKSSVELCEMFADRCMNLIVLLQRYGLIRDDHL